MSIETAVTLLSDGQPLTPGSPAGQARPPKMVGRYVLLEQVGAGGMGIVHRAYDPALDRRVAVKLLRAEAAKDSPRAQALLREGRAIAQINHPNVISIYDVSTHGEH